jgi:hypothetical protein
MQLAGLEFQHFVVVYLTGFYQILGYPPNVKAITDDPEVY